MTRSTETRPPGGRSRRAAVLLLLAVAASGCWSGAVQKAAALREEPAAYHAAWSDGERLLLAYEARVTGPGGVVREHRKRTL